MNILILQDGNEYTAHQADSLTELFQRMVVQISVLGDLIEDLPQAPKEFLAAWEKAEEINISGDFEHTVRQVV